MTNTHCPCDSTKYCCADHPHFDNWKTNPLCECESCNECCEGDHWTTNELCECNSELECCEGDTWQSNSAHCKCDSLKECCPHDNYDWMINKLCDCDRNKYCCTDYPHFDTYSSNNKCDCPRETVCCLGDTWANNKNCVCEPELDDNACCPTGTFYSKDYKRQMYCCSAGNPTCCDPLKDDLCKPKVICEYKGDPVALKYCVDVLAPLGTDCDHWMLSTCPVTSCPPETHKIFIGRGTVCCKNGDPICCDPELDATCPTKCDDCDVRRTYVRSLSTYLPEEQWASFNVAWTI